VPEAWTGVTLARLVRARGRKGEVAAEILTDFPERLTRLREVWLWDGSSEPRHVGVRACWLHKQQAIFHFEGYDSISDAEKLVGLQVQVPLSERLTLPSGSYYVTDLMGCEVWEMKEVQDVKEGKEVKDKGAPSQSFTSFTPSTSLLGVVRDVQFTGEDTPGPPLLVVETPKGDELLIPLAEEICRRMDMAARRIEVVLPEGLRELNE
jgi:16S rRNA processing protein RimM